jgi:nicotinate-nucleotide adenylyltransferase
MRIALFGGSFDPPHIGHQLACLYVLSTHAVDEVWMLPCAQHPFAKQMAPFAHRAAMCQLATAHLTGVRVCTIEGELPGPSYTLNTVRALSERHPEHEFLLVIGADLLHERERWHGAAELCQRVRFIVLGRSQSEPSSLGRPHLSHPRTDPAQTGHSDHTGHEGKPTPHDIRHAEAVDLPPISSTAVRAALAAGKSPGGWLARGVLTYIQEQALYVVADRQNEPDSRPTEARPKEDSHAI